ERVVDLPRRVDAVDRALDAYVHECQVWALALRNRHRRRRVIADASDHATQSKEPGFDFVRDHGLVLDDQNPHTLREWSTPIIHLHAPTASRQSRPYPVPMDRQPARTAHRSVESAIG